MSSPPRIPGKPLTSRWLGLLTAAFVALLLVVRLTDLTGVLGHAGDNASALKMAMSATPDLLNAEMVENMTDPATAVTGLQARSMARAMTAIGRPSSAEAWLVAGLSDPKSAYLTQFQLCLLYWEIGLRDRALQACQGSVVSAGYWLGSGFRALDNGDNAEALAYFELAAFTDPNMVEGWRRYGQSLLDAGRPQEAVVALERVLFLTSSPTADVYRSLADAYLKVDNLTMARDVLDEGLLKFPDQREYYSAMAESFLAEGDAKTADSWYVRMGQRWPYDASVWAARGQIAQDDGRIDDAIKYFREAAANSPDGFGHWMSLAEAAAKANNPALVSQATARALALRPEEPGAWLQSGRYLMEVDQVDEARSAFEHVLVLQPENVDAVDALATLADPATP